MSSQEEQAQRAFMQRQLQQMALQAQQKAPVSMFQLQAKMNEQMASTQSRNNQMSIPYDDVPMELGDEPPSLLISSELNRFLSACRNGDLPNLQEALSSIRRTPRVLVQGLDNALVYGKVEVARFLLESGAPISRAIPNLIILKSPAEKRIFLFEALTQHGWTVNTPGFYGEVLLPKVIGTRDESLINWFLAQGGDPNLGCQKLFQDRLGEPDRNSCDSLEAAARAGSVDLVRKLLDAGAKISNGAPLYCAAGVCPPGTSLSSY